MKKVLPITCFFLLNMAIPLAHARDFMLKDFVGAWIFSAHTIGGLGQETGSGEAIGGIKRFVFDATGTGKVNAGTVVVYGADNKLGVFDINEEDAITLKLTDPASGAGTLTSVDTKNNKTVIYRFLAARNKSGKATRMHLIDVAIYSEPANVIIMGELNRQDE